MTLAEKLLHSFPVPSRIAMPAVGLDISDHSVKFLELVHSHDGYRVGRFATKEIPEGIIVGGTITKRDALVTLLSDFRKEHGLTFVRASLPEEPINQKSETCSESREHRAAVARVRVPTFP